MAKDLGKLYMISAEAVVKDREKVEQRLFKDICECLMKNGILTIYSEETIPGVQVTYGWKLKRE